MQFMIVSKSKSGNLNLQFANITINLLFPHCFAVSLNEYSAEIFVWGNIIVKFFFGSRIILKSPAKVLPHTYPVDISAGKQPYY